MLKASPKIVGTTLMGLLLLPTASLAETAFISDELLVPLRGGPSGSHRILHRGLPSGTELTILSVDEEAGFTQVRTPRGTEGWVRSQYLLAEPIAKIKLVSANREIDRLKRALTEERNKNATLSNANQAQQNANQQGSERISQLEQELARITELSASAVETHEENLRLKDTNQRLIDELDDTADERNRLEANETNTARMMGAGFVLLGLIFGVLIKSRPRRSSWN